MAPETLVTIRPNSPGLHIQIVVSGQNAKLALGSGRQAEFAYHVGEIVHNAVIEYLHSPEGQREVEQL